MVMRKIGFALALGILLQACALTQSGTPTPASGGTAQWQQLASMPTARSEMPAAALDGLIYVPGGFGGETVFEAYDTVNNSWAELAVLPEGRHHLMAVAHGGTVYVLGGGKSMLNWEPQSTTWAFDPEKGDWEERAPMPEPRLAGAAVSLGDYLYVIGGTGGTGALLRYDPAADTWTSLAALEQMREHTAAVAFEGRIYAIGGRWSGQGELRSVEIYDPGLDVWSAGSPLNEARGGFAATVVADRIVVAGGEVLAGNNRALNNVEVLHAQGSEWVFGPALPVGLHGVPAVEVDGNVYVIGGADIAGTAINQGRLFVLPETALP